MKYSFFLLVAIGLFACINPQITLADCWQSASNEQNQLQFSVTHEQDVIQGTFTDFAVRFCQTAEKPEELHVTVATASATTGNGLADAALASTDFLAAEQYPQAVYKAADIQQEKAGFMANGELTLHGITQPVSVFFSLERKGNTMVLSGHANLQRLAFNIGQGEWQATDELANEVMLEFVVILKPGASGD